MLKQWLAVVLLVMVLGGAHAKMMTNAKKKPLVDESKCPRVKPMRHFNLNKVQGDWTVQEFYASSEEALAYRCMRAHLDVHMTQAGLDVLMNFNYSYIDDPQHDVLLGNISWTLPDVRQPAHWIHAEDTYEGVYNTYVLDTDYTAWLVLLHCAEKDKEPRYLSALVMSRNPKSLEVNVSSYLRDKLARYGVTLDFLFPMQQTNCPDKKTAIKSALPPFKRH